MNLDELAALYGKAVAGPRSGEGEAAITHAAKPPSPPRGRMDLIDAGRLLGLDVFAPGDRVSAAGQKGVVDAMTVDVTGTEYRVRVDNSDSKATQSLWFREELVEPA